MLKIDFPRVPLTGDLPLFWQLATQGDRLVQLHLMKATGSEISHYPIAGSNRVEKINYHPTQQQVWINSEQYFSNVSGQVWNFYVGGDHVCQKWLKDRQGRELSFEDLLHYQNIIASLSETIATMSEIDRLIHQHRGFPFRSGE